MYKDHLYSHLSPSRYQLQKRSILAKHIQDLVNVLLSDYQTISMASICLLHWIGTEYIPSGQCNEDKCSFEYKVMICMISMLKVNIQMFINNHLHNPL